MGIVERYFAIIGMVIVGNVAAMDMDQTEYDLLPAYCRNQGNVSERLFKPDNEIKWRNALGKDFMHIHHYCWAMVFIARSYKPGLSDSVRRYNLSEAIAGINFSLQRASEDFVLIPEMYFRLGEAYLGLRDDKNAQAAFEKSWTANPAYSPAYVWWAQRLLRQGKTREALAIAEEGKKNAPESKSLDNLVKEIQSNLRVNGK